MTYLILTIQSPKHFKIKYKIEVPYFSLIVTQQSRDSSVGRAVDCSGLKLKSIGHWFDSGSRDLFAKV